jgi:hypothetical protein
MNTDTIISFITPAIPYYIVFDVVIFAMIIFTQMISNTVSSWPSVQGKIKTSHLGVGRGEDPTPGAYVSYTYAIEGTTYEGWGISPGFRMNSRRIAKGIVKRYPRGADVTVYYNPKKPSHAYLENGARSLVVFWVLAVLGNLFMPFIVWLLKTYFRL